MLNKNNCTGCEKCREKCPYNVIDINPCTEQSEKCDFCYNKIQRGELPICVRSCMGKALVFGDINDPESEISTILKKEPIKALNPYLGTNPSVFYLLKRVYNNIPLKEYEIPRRPSLKASQKSTVQRQSPRNQGLN